MTQPTLLPTIALFSGDPAGVGPELTEKLLRRPGLQAQTQEAVVPCYRRCSASISAALNPAACRAAMLKGGLRVGAPWRAATSA